MEDIISKRLSIEQLPMITVIVKEDGVFFSLNNRRLWVLKELRKGGLLKNNTVKVRVKAALARERDRYTIDRCSITCQIMKEVGGGGGGEEEIEIEDAGDGDATDDLAAAGGAEVEYVERDRALIDAAGVLSLGGGDNNASVFALGLVGGAGGASGVGGGGVLKSGKELKSSKTARTAALRVPPLDPKIEGMIKSLSKTVAKGTKGSIAQVSSQLDEWLEDGLLLHDQMDELKEKIGMKR